MAKSPVLPLARLAEAKVIQGKTKGKGQVIKGKTEGKGPFPAKAMAKQKARDYFLASPRLPKAKAKAKAMAKQKARDRIQNLEFNQGWHTVRVKMVSMLFFVFCCCTNFYTRI